MAKLFLFRGRTLEELKKMDLSEFSQLLKSRQRRKIKHGFTDQEKMLLKRIIALKKGDRKKPIKTHVRTMMVIPEMVGLIMHIHNGKEFVPVSITEHMLGHYLGEFVITRKKVEHSAPGIGATKSSAALSVK